MTNDLNKTKALIREPESFYDARLPQKDLLALAADHTRLEDRLHKCEGMANEMMQYREMMQFFGIEKTEDGWQYRPSVMTKFRKLQNGTEHQKLTEENREMEEALEHYADARNWSITDYGDRIDQWVNDQHPDGPDVARDVLAKLKP